MIKEQIKNLNIPVDIADLAISLVNAETFMMRHIYNPSFECSLLSRDENDDRVFLSVIIDFPANTTSLDYSSHQLRPFIDRCQVKVKDGKLTLHKSYYLYQHS